MDFCLLYLLKYVAASTDSKLEHCISIARRRLHRQCVLFAYFKGLLSAEMPNSVFGNSGYPHYYSVFAIMNHCLFRWIRRGIMFIVNKDAPSISYDV